MTYYSMKIFIANKFDLKIGTKNLELSPLYMGSKVGLEGLVDSPSLSPQSSSCLSTFFRPNLVACKL